MASQTWLVTGGAGFIGANFVRWALEQRPDVTVVVLDKLTYAGSLENLRDLPAPDRFRFEQGDIASARDVRTCFERHAPDAILNFAAESHVDRSIDGPRAFVDTNIVGTFELLEAARARFAELPAERRERFRFLHVSTDEVYGSLGASGFFTEETPYAPNSPYSASKAGADLLVRAYHRTYGLPTITTNCSNNYGPHQFPEKLIPLMILNALEGKAASDLRRRRQRARLDLRRGPLCRDRARARSAGQPGESYAFGGDSERSNLQVVDAICDGLERMRPAKSNEALRARDIASYRELKSFVEDRPGHDRRYAIDASKSRRELDWRPDHAFESALEETIAWYLANEPWRLAIQAESDARARQGLGGTTPAADRAERDAR